MIDLTADAWEKRYQEGQDRWDLGCPAPPLINLLASAQAPKVGKIAVLGCGSGQDAMLFSTAEFDVVGFDFAPSAIERARATAKARELDAQFLQRNIFELEAEFLNSFDYVLEHTCFCTIDATLRPKYVQVVKNLLRPNGQLIALFYTHSRANGPPFCIKPQAVLDLFAPHFDILLFKTAQDSIARRKGEEHLAIFQMRSS
ncbi:methyltransferase domain-containing protein [Limnofasciculus baicalensis]|uniref:TPMT family class I SAM-dependent methyltransferase n=1 Tax=Limnofasciculus baicalensis BBK-W-15 TaxID=2699891 RepID=A0AAE3KLT4_9CYAN|nr:methyltransferase domain-containing protein [Limnofasciculus baicalensis]MCP2726988.1 TPMT family class I SAM-dependent methyltransferase [Limnofasciculus baicalensis BBK-W-15]